MSLAGQISQVLADPNVAYLLLTLGVVGLLAELAHPGALFPGITAAIALVLGFIGLGDLPVAPDGVVLIAVAAALLVAELWAGGHGVLAFAGLASFALGSVMLFDPAPGAPDARVAPWLIVLTTATVGGALLFALRATAAAYRAPIRTGIEALVGRTGVAVTAVAPTGLVRIDREDWTARTRDGAIPPGAPVLVTAVQGVTVEIRRAPA